MKKLCGCKRNLIDLTEKFCNECKKKYNKEKSVSVNESFYKSVRWTKLSKLVRDKYNGLDLYQLKINGIMVESKQVHHIIPIKDNPTLKWDMRNLIPLSISTHKHIEAIYKTKDKEKMQKILLELVKQGI